MKGFRLFVYFLLCLILATAALSFFMATHQAIKKTVTIKAPASAIYAQLVRLENFKQVSVWDQQDSSLIYSPAVNDGAAGGSIGWKGSPEISGEGKIEITGLEKEKKITHTISFTKPKKGTAESVFLLQQKDTNTTEVTWDFKLATPRPWNIFNLFFSLDKQMGGDFEKGLAALKGVMENQNPVK
jgi:hypothetical protein